MMRNFIYLTIGILVLYIISSCSQRNKDDDSDRIKIVVREVGNQLLLNHQDSTSLVLPVKALDSFKYQLSFEKDLGFNPDDLVRIIQSNFEKSQLSNQYVVEVLHCDNREVAYSYQMSANEEQTIIPCLNRRLPESCYIIEVGFSGKRTTPSDRRWFIFLFGFITIAFIVYGLIKRKGQPKPKAEESYIKIGSFKFYERQNKLIKEAEEITLSKKECELLAIFVSRPNEIITREELTKKVWEDNGVIVGRSLDTFISKLRKKLKDDRSIKISNVHGVGYRLEVY